jgi:retron-type reverse transcriptase
VPVFKSGDPLSCDNYRPISLVKSFSKVLEKIVSINLVNHLELNNLIYRHQYGFQRGKSTEHNLLHVINNVGNALNDGMYCVGVFLDLKKAFDVCNHNILLKKMEKYGIVGTELEWFKSYLTGRSQVVDINGAHSNPHDIDISVIQGSILGPIMFLIYINDLPNATNPLTFMFADDTSMLK